MATHEERLAELEGMVRTNIAKFEVVSQQRVALDTKHLLWEALLEVKIAELEKLELKVWCHDIDNFVKISRRVLYAVGIGALLTFVGAILAFIFGGGLNV